MENLLTEIWEFLKTNIVLIICIILTFIVKIQFEKKVTILTWWQIVIRFIFAFTLGVFVGYYCSQLGLKTIYVIVSTSLATLIAESFGTWLIQSVIKFKNSIINLKKNKDG